MLKRFCIVVIFSVAFAYIEAAVVVYLRTIFYPGGFTFPLTNFAVTPLWNQLWLTEVGREAATLVIILTSALLFSQNPHQRTAFFLTIFACWDIFYYVWLKILINWPVSIMDWDVLFLMPTTWAGPVLAPILVSGTLLVFATIILYHSSIAKPVNATLIDRLGFITCAIVIVVSFCIAGLNITESDFQAYFYWPLFAAGLLSAVALFTKCILQSR
jgi:hypothetical protein